MKMGKAMIGGLGLAAALAGGLGADMRHLNTPALRLERLHKARKGLYRGDPRDPKRKKTTRAWRKHVRRPPAQRRKDRSKFHALVRANPANQMTNRENTAWMAACCKTGKWVEVDPAPYVARSRRGTL